MALAVDSQESGGTAHRGDDATPLTWNFTNTGGDLILVGVVVTCATGTGTASISAVSYGGDALTAIGTGQAYGTNSNLVQWWYRRTAVKTGSNQVSVTGSTAGGSAPAILAGAISFSGSDSGTPVGSEVKATGSSGTSATGSIASSAASFLVALVAEGSGTAPSAGSGNTLSASLAGSGITGGDNIGIEYWDSDGSSRDMQFTFPSDSWGTVGVEVLASGGNSSSVSPSVSPSSSVSPSVSPSSSVSSSASPSVSPSSSVSSSASPSVAPPAFVERTVFVYID